MGSSKVHRRFFFFISCPEEKFDCFDMSGKIVCCFIHPLGTCWTSRSLSHTAVENIPVRSQKVSNPTSPSVRVDIALLPVKTLETEPLYDSTMKDFVWTCSFSWKNQGRSAERHLRGKMIQQSRQTSLITVLGAEIVPIVIDL